jgi:hypothetical protein
MPYPERGKKQQQKTQQNRTLCVFRKMQFLASVFLTHLGTLKSIVVSSISADA